MFDFNDLPLWLKCNNPDCRAALSYVGFNNNMVELECVKCKCHKHKINIRHTGLTLDNVIEEMSRYELDRMTKYP